MTWGSQCCVYRRLISVGVKVYKWRGWPCGRPRGEEVPGKNKGADQTLRRWWDAPSGSSRVKTLHKALLRHRGSGSEVMSVKSRRSCLCTRRTRAVKCLNNVQCICPSSHPGTLKETSHTQRFSLADVMWGTERLSSSMSLNTFHSRKSHLLT